MIEKDCSETGPDSVTDELAPCDDENMYSLSNYYIKNLDTVLNTTQFDNKPLDINKYDKADEYLTTGYSSQPRQDREPPSRGI